MNRPEENEVSDERIQDSGMLLGQPVSTMTNKALAITRRTPPMPPWLFALLAMLLVLATELVIEHFAWRSALNAEKSSVHERLSTVQARLEGVINANLLLVHGLTAVISAQPDIDQHGFARIARGLIDERHALRNIAGAPDMVISLMHPMAGNEAALGMNYLNDPSQGAAARRVMETGRAVVAGPLTLRQGGVGIVAREPVYVPASTSGERPRFWGLVSAVIDADQLYRLAELKAAEPKLRLAIRGTDGTGANGPVFYGDPTVFEQTPITKEVSLPGGSWQLAAIPAAGWGKAADALWLIRLLGLLAGLAAGAMAWRLALGTRALSKTVARLRTLLGTIPDLVWMKDLEGVYLSCNPRFEAFFGAAEAAIVGKTDHDFVAADLADFFREKDKAAILAAGPSINEEWVTFASDGHPELLETIKTPVFDQTGKLLGVLGIARDITERKQSAERINGLIRVYAVLSGINEAIVRQRDRDSLFREACRIAVEVGGFRMAWLGMADTGTGEVRPQAHAGVADGYLDRLHISLGDDEHGLGPTGTALRQGHHVVCNDIAGDPRMAPWREAALALGYRASAALPIKVGGQVRGTFNLYAERADFFDDAELRLLDELALDIGFALDYMETEAQARQAEEALRGQEAFFRLIAENMGDLVAVLDLNGRRLYNSPSYRALFGDPDALKGSDSFAEIHPDDRELVRQVFLRTVETGVGQRVNFRFVLATGDVRELESQGGVIRGPAGEVAQVVVVSRDITERKHMEDEIRQLNAELEERVRQRTAELAAVNKELETFTYSVSHDLKAPLRGIDGYSRLLLEDHLGQLDDEGKQFLGNVRHGVDQMNQLIEDLLAYSRMERRDLRGMTLDLTRQIGGILAERQEELEAAGIVVTTDLSADTARADPDGLHMVLRNLLDNAIKFSRHSQPPVIEIRTSAMPESTILSIKDNGIGFDMQFQERIFEIFQRLQRAEEYPGTGVGLAIVRKAMQRMGGRVWAESSPGQGATFYLELPK